MPGALAVDFTVYLWTTGGLQVVANLGLCNWGLRLTTGKWTANAEYIQRGCEERTREDNRYTDNEDMKDNTINNNNNNKKEKMWIRLWRGMALTPKSSRPATYQNLCFYSSAHTQLIDALLFAVVVNYQVTKGQSFKSWSQSICEQS